VAHGAVSGERSGSSDGDVKRGLVALRFAAADTVLQYQCTTRLAHPQSPASDNEMLSSQRSPVKLTDSAISAFFESLHPTRSSVWPVPQRLDAGVGQHGNDWKTWHDEKGSTRIPVQVGILVDRTDDLRCAAAGIGVASPAFGLLSLQDIVQWNEQMPVRKRVLSTAVTSQPTAHVYVEFSARRADTVAGVVMEGSGSLEARCRTEFLRELGVFCRQRGVEEVGLARPSNAVWYAQMDEPDHIRMQYHVLSTALPLEQMRWLMLRFRNFLETEAQRRARHTEPTLLLCHLLTRPVAQVLAQAAPLQQEEQYFHHVINF